MQHRPRIIVSAIGSLLVLISFWFIILNMFGFVQQALPWARDIGPKVHLAINIFTLIAGMWLWFISIANDTD